MWRSVLGGADFGGMERNFLIEVGHCNMLSESELKQWQEEIRCEHTS